MEKYFFRNNFWKYTAEYTPTENRPDQWALWAVHLNKNKSHFLGTIVGNKLLELPYEKMKDFEWSVVKGAQRLYGIISYELNKTGGYAKMFAMRSDLKKDRNIDLVQKRLSDPKKWSWGRLAKLYNIDRTTVREIFWRDVEKFASLATVG